MQELTGGRLHLSDGPMDVVLKAFGAPDCVARAHRAAARRFAEILPELCAELAALRQPVIPASLQGWRGERDERPRPFTSLHSNPPPHPSPPPQGGRGSPPRSPVGRRMFAACRPFAETFVTPMAAVAGSVADELLCVMRQAAPLRRAYVNDGGDIAVYCAAGEVIDIAVAGDFRFGVMPARSGSIRITHGDGVGGIATSGARGRSFSLGIADSVTVLAADAATADVAATLIGNAVDCDDPAIERRPAVELDPDSDLGDLPVTVRVGPLPSAAITTALRAGLVRASLYRRRGLIVDAALTLQGRTVTLSAERIAP